MSREAILREAGGMWAVTVLQDEIVDKDHTVQVQVQVEYRPSRMYGSLELQRTLNLYARVGFEALAGWTIEYV